MPAKLIIKDAHQERTFELRSPAMVLGREPGCDLQFLDTKLSRRHARFDVTPQCIRLTDLGTTNGSFVNGERITESYLKHGDRITLGNLEITFLNEAPQHDANTVLTPPKGQPAVDLSPPPTPPAVESHTVFLDAQKLQELSQKPPGPASPTPGPPTSPAPLKPSSGTFAFDPQQMQRLSQQPAASPPLPTSRDQGTQILAPPVGSGAEQGGRTMAIAGPAADRLATTAPLPQESPEALAPVVREVQKKVVSHIRFPSMAWRTKFTLMLTLTLTALVLVISVPLLIIQNKATARVSLERGMALTKSLAAANRFAVINHQMLQIETGFVAREAGVKQVMIMDSTGKVLAPSMSSGQMVVSIEGIAVKPPQIKMYYDGVTSEGDYNMVAPIKNDDAQTVGLVWLTFTPISLSESTSTIAVVIMLVIFLAVMVGAVLVWSATNMTVKPLTNLVDATESVVKGDAFTVEELAGFAEVNALARSINRLIERGGMPGAGQAAPALPFQAPISSAVAPPGPTPTSTGVVSPSAESGELVVDANFTIIRVSGFMEKWLDATTGELIGKHVIEGVREQKLLESVLDLVNLLTTQPSASQEVDFSSVPSLGGVFVVAGKKLSPGDQMTIRLSRK